MKTASFFTYDGPGRISIARWAPSGYAGFAVFPAMAPDGDMLKLPREDYLPRYAAILARLDPEATWKRLHLLAQGQEPVLLCWERPPFTAKNWCHRRLVAAWFEERLQVSVPEIEPVHPQLTLF